MSIKEIQYRLPDDFIKILEKIFTRCQLDTIYKSYENGRSTTFRVNKLKGNTKEVMDELSSHRIKAVNYSKLNNTFIIKGSKESSLKKLKIYNEGKIYLQNISSMLPPLFLDVKEGQTILDMCAAPGGKSLLMADMTSNKATIFANDINEIRRERLNYNAEKQGAESIIILGTDGRTIGKRLNDYFDKILLDAPCSGEGIIHIRNFRKFNGWTEKRVRNCVKLQKQLIESAYNALKENGVMIYSTCTLNPFENEEIVEYILNKHKDLKLEKINLDLPNVIRGITRYEDKFYRKDLKNSIRIIPNEIFEGFFIAKFRKINSY
ncbi:RsmB/NOP family class I SAM-dependent RNA methyltransferase [Clostridium septicum]|uniref:RsmB/NOP family class I SAM-dependent RNA methyltransferase n=1 Tax=Clostridium septicum TaxID=1504 RepID=UPI00272E608F|nr:RsmB/NOP family class I SAM-dependent RNA methyltransferase [Clostridium septicum]WLF70686.1 RsmB/NOP family class I SAM-dependent RNA methyltransferase [Clostridium septicum]